MKYEETAYIFVCHSSSSSSEAREYEIGGRGHRAYPPRPSITREHEMMIKFNIYDDGWGGKYIYSGRSLISIIKMELEEKVTDEFLKGIASIVYREIINGSRKLVDIPTY